MKTHSVLSCLVLLFLAVNCSNPNKILTDPGVILPPQQEVGKPLASAVPLQMKAVDTFMEGIANRKPEAVSQALTLLDEAVKIDPNYHFALSTKANFLDALQRHQEAAEAYTRALAIRPQAAEYYIGRAISLGKLGNSEQAKESARYAIAAFNLRIQKEPQNPFFVTDRAFAVYLAGYPELALKELNAVLNEFPNELAAKELKEKIESPDPGRPWNILDE